MRENLEEITEIPYLDIIDNKITPKLKHYFSAPTARLKQLQAEATGVYNQQKI